MVQSLLPTPLSQLLTSLPPSAEGEQTEKRIGHWDLTTMCGKREQVPCLLMLHMLLHEILHIVLDGFNSSNELIPEVCHVGDCP